MDANTWMQAISTYGFPIVACVVMFKYLEQERETHKAELESVTKALNENTRIISELKRVIDTMAEAVKHDS